MNSFRNINIFLLLRMTHDLGVIILHPSLAIGLEKAAPVARRVSRASRALAANTAAAIAADDTTGAEEHSGDEKASHGAPGEAVGLLAERGAVAAFIEGIATFNSPGGHQSSGQCLEEERNRRVQAGEIPAKSAAQGQQACEQRADGEEEGDQVEGPHEAGQVVVLVCPNELTRYIRGGAEVPRRIKRQRGHYAAAIGVVAFGVGAANGEEGPSRGIPRAGDAADVAGLEEVDLVLGAAVYGAGEDDEELEEDAAGEDDE